MKIKTIWKEPEISCWIYMIYATIDCNIVSMESFSVRNSNVLNCVITLNLWQVAWHVEKKPPATSIFGDLKLIHKIIMWLWFTMHKMNTCMTGDLFRLLHMFLFLDLFSCAFKSLDNKWKRNKKKSQITLMKKSPKRLVKRISIYSLLNYLKHVKVNKTQIKWSTIK